MYNHFSETLPRSPHTQAFISDLAPKAERLLAVPTLSLPYSAFRLFHETGSRVEYENAYFAHRKKLSAFCGMALAKPEEGKWLTALADVIWAILDEFTWALPAHIPAGASSEAAVTRIDLFAAETAMGLAEVCEIFAERLPDAVTDRVRYEVRRRVVDPYVRNCPHNRFGINNWSAVCACGVGSAMIELGFDAEFQAAKENLLANMNDFLKSYNDDGCCMEGPLYWSYGFAFFCYFAELLEEYTAGEIAFFAAEKVKKIALFADDMFLSENHVIPFSDSPHELGFDRGIFRLLGSRFGTKQPPEQYENRFGDDVRYRFAAFIRNLFWDFPVQERKTKATACRFYPDAAWYITKKGDRLLAAKGGHNDEPHNHNDVGSFVFFADGAFLLDDPGWVKYDKDYFGKDTRYKNPVAASRGHSVPLFDGKEQQPGKDRRAKVLQADENAFAIEFSAAYDGCVDRLERRFELTQDALIINDCFKNAKTPVTERFATRIRPVVDGHDVIIGTCTLSCSAAVTPSVSSFDFIPRFSGLDGSEDVSETVYLIDYGLRGEENVTFTIKAN